MVGCDFEGAKRVGGGGGGIGDRDYGERGWNADLLAFSAAFDVASLVGSWVISDITLGS